MEDEETKKTSAESFRARWSAFMEGGWEALLEKDAAIVAETRRAALALIPTHPHSIHLGELAMKVVPAVDGITGPHLFAVLLDMDRHGHVECVAGWIFRPSPRVPRRGLCLEDMFYKFGCAPARER